MMPTFSNVSMTRLSRRKPTLWWDAARGDGSVDPALARAHAEAVDDASARLERFAPLLARLFPERPTGGRLMADSGYTALAERGEALHCRIDAGGDDR